MEKTKKTPNRFYKDEERINSLARAYFLPNGQFGSKEAKNELAAACLSLAEGINRYTIRKFPVIINNAGDDIAEQTITKLLKKQDVDPDKFYNLFKSALRRKTIDACRRTEAWRQSDHVPFYEGIHTHNRPPKSDPAFPNQTVIELKTPRHEIDIGPLVEAIVNTIPRDRDLATIMELKLQGKVDTEIAKETGIPLGSVKTKVGRFRRYMLEAIGERFTDEIKVIRQGELDHDQAGEIVSAVVKRLAESPKIGGFKHRARAAASVDGDGIAR